MPEEPTTTIISRKRMASPSKITREYSLPKVGSVLSAEAEPAKGISRLTIITRMETSGDYSVPDAIVALLDLWIKSLIWDEPTVISEPTESGSDEPSEGK